MAHEYIGIDKLIDLLGGEKKRGSRGEHICMCPAHNDHKPSLSVKEGDKGIVMKCMSRGCSAQDICERIGISVADLFKDQKAQGQRTGSAGKRRSAAKNEFADTPPAKTFMSYDEAYGWQGRLVCTYPYRDSRGALRFEVARLVDGDGKKTFRQHRPVDPDGSGKCVFPIRLDVPAALRENIIYRQRETEDAVRRGETVYIVEGEKDCDSLASLGRAATTNAGGGGKDRWKEGHAEHLKGAKEVIIIPDNDSTGMAHAEEVYESLVKAADAVYIINLKDGYPELGEKGDFTDLADEIGDSEALEILDRLSAEARESLLFKARRIYSQIPGYGIVNGCTCQISDGLPKMLCNFVALPQEIIEKDDGLTVEKFYRIAGWNRKGKALKPAMVPINQFKSMDWVIDNWDVEANIMPGNTVKDKLRWVMTEAASEAVKRTTIYTHCGWQIIDGKWAYLHRGGAIGAEGVDLDMGYDLQGYTLGGLPEDVTAEDAALTSYTLSLFLPPKIGVPLLGVTYLAPLCEFFEQSLNPPAFVTALIGQHGTHKTTVASLFLNHFGRFGIRGMPANFSSTVNSIRNSAFAAKDTLLVVDDYFPASSIQERRKMETIMQIISRAYGDRAVRGRLKADLSQQAAKPARGLALITGEHKPDIGSSGNARMYVINFDRRSYTYSRELDKLRDDATRGVLRLAMTKYIEWLLPQADGLQDKLERMFMDYKGMAHEMISGAATNDRADDAAAHIMTGLRMMTDWLKSLGVMGEDEQAANMAEWWHVVIENIKEQGSEDKDDSPCSLFMAAVSEMLISGVIVTINVSDLQPRAPVKGMCGYHDDSNYYFLPDQLYGMVTKFYNDQNRVFPLSKTALFKIMREEKIVEQWDNAENKTTKQKIINGKNKRYLWIPRWKLDGRKPPEPEAEQVSMDINDKEEINDVFPD